MRALGGERKKEEGKKLSSGREGRSKGKKEDSVGRRKEGRKEGSLGRRKGGKNGRKDAWEGEKLG